MQQPNLADCRKERRVSIIMVKLDLAPVASKEWKPSGKMLEAGCGGREICSIVFIGAHLLCQL